MPLLDTLKRIIPTRTKEVAQPELPSNLVHFFYSAGIIENSYEYEERLVDKKGRSIATPEKINAAKIHDIEEYIKNSKDSIVDLIAKVWCCYNDKGNHHAEKIEALNKYLSAGGYLFGEQKDSFEKRLDCIEQNGDCRAFDEIIKYQDKAYEFPTSFFSESVQHAISPDFIKTADFGVINAAYDAYQAGDYEVWRAVQNLHKKGVKSYKYPSYNKTERLKTFFTRDDLQAQILESVFGNDAKLDECRDIYGAFLSLGTDIDRDKIIEKMNPQDLKAAEFVSAILDYRISGNDLSTTYFKVAKLEPAHNVQQLERFKETYFNFKRNQFINGIPPIDMSNTRHENGVDIVTYDGQNFDLLIHEVIDWATGRPQYEAKSKVAHEMTNNPKLFYDADYYNENILAINHQVNNSDGILNTLSTSLISTNNINTFGAMSAGRKDKGPFNGEALITLVYNGVTADQVLGTYAGDAATPKEMRSSPNRQSLWSFEDLKGFSGRQAETIGRYNEVLLSRQKVVRNNEIVDINKREFIRPTAVLLPIGGMKGSNHNRREVAMNAAKELGIPLIELHLDKYQNKDIPYEYKSLERVKTNIKQTIDSFVGAIKPSHNASTLTHKPILCT
ncbi:MAG: hypothetical protein LBM38_03155 [Clostridiales bacterium]|jgi:hypothetical protein|nr:hypothetical protein [Clostridiales bacterium]